MDFTASQERQRAEQMVERFIDRFQPCYRFLAYYAALPLLLTPELVNYLRVEFLRDENVPWVAEVDLLLSDLCRQVGYELYTIDTAIRAYLLEEMKRELGIERMQEVAKSLIGYIRYLFQNNSYISAKELQAQQWAAMVYLEETREQVVREIAEGFESYGTSAIGKGLVNLADLARLANITKELAPELINYQNLLDYAGVVSKVVANASEIKHEDIKRSYQILPDIELRIPDDLVPDNLISDNLQQLELSTSASISEFISPFSRKATGNNSRDFFDREELLQQIFQILAQGGNISLVGESAIGKTSILHQICNQGKERLRSMGVLARDFVYFNLQLVTNEEEFYEALCDVLEIPFSPGYQLVRALRNKHYVLCLDEIEKLDDSAFTSNIRSLLRGLADGIDEPLKLIIAGRSPLDILF
ncbi:MAG: ATP-binding protein, partial [Calothrix sp. CSU_2_0]|nr:ATP-binding protein [Calothrix sp. CSU_2_0]